MTRISFTFTNKLKHVRQNSKYKLNANKHKFKRWNGQIRWILSHKFLCRAVKRLFSLTNCSSSLMSTASPTLYNIQSVVIWNFQSLKIAAWLACVAVRFKTWRFVHKILCQMVDAFYIAVSMMNEFQYSNYFWQSLNGKIFSNWLQIVNCIQQ